jgi:SAM-dependent methyltransferase
VHYSAEQVPDSMLNGMNVYIEDSLHFIHGNALSLPCQDQHYDGGWFFESIFHMGHREALREAGRVLKPGATLVLTDLPLLARTTEEFKAFVKTHIHSTFVAVEDYPALMAEAGFELVAIEDISLNVMTKLVPKLKDAMTEYQEVIAKTLSGDVEKTTDDWLYMFEYMSENLGYMIVTARKL